MYSPLSHWGCLAGGKRVGIVGIGGLGQMGVSFNCVSSVNSVNSVSSLKRGATSISDGIVFFGASLKFTSHKGH